MLKAIFLDSGPLGLATQRKGKSPRVDACQNWLAGMDRAGVAVYVPEIIDYELRRELLRANAISGIARLDRLHTSARYLPLNTPALRLAADLWAQSRQKGFVTAHPKAIDVDVILCAQALTVGMPRAEFVVATVNVSHLSRFVPAQEWEYITL